MATKISELTAVPSVDPADLVEIVDASDTTDGPAGSSKSATFAQIAGAAPVQSVFGRSGAVVAAADDYDVSEVTDAVGSKPQGGEVQVTDVIGLTQTEYDAIGTPDVNTLYLITGP